MPLKEEVFRSPRCGVRRGCDHRLQHLLSRRRSAWPTSLPRRRGNVLGLHFFSPAHAMRLLEVVRTESASTGDPGHGARAGAAARQDCGRRWRLPRLHRQPDARRLYVAGALPAGGRRKSPSEIDAAITGFGMAMGPCAVADLAGLDVSWRKRKADAHLRDPSKRYSVVADRLCERSRFGQKTGAGYYRYEPGSRTPILGSLRWTPLSPRSRRKAASPAAQIGADEIVQRLLYPLVNEGARHPRRGHRAARQRHRHHLDQRLRLSPLAGRRDALGRQRRASTAIHAADRTLRR